MCEWERLSFNTCKYNEKVYRTYFIYGLFVFYQPPFTCSKSTVETMCEIFSKLTIKTSELRQWYLSGVFIVNLEQVLKIVLVFPLLTFNQINVGWDKVTSLVGSCPKAKNNSLSLSLSFYYWRI